MPIAQDQDFYPQLHEKLKEIGALTSVSDLHGHLCGRHVVGHHLEGGFGMRMVSDYIDLPVVDLEPVAELLNQLIEQWVLIMDQELFDFRLLLPADDHALVSRLDELGRWSEGFLSGVASTAGSDEVRIIKEEQETLADLVEISKIDCNVEDTDENEALYAEISEYVRLAAFNLFDQFRELAERIAKEELEAGEPN